VPEIVDVRAEKELDVRGVNAGPIAHGESEFEAVFSIGACGGAHAIEMEFVLARRCHHFLIFIFAENGDI
jgi:hypothetical protein